VLQKAATLHELETVYSYEDALKLYALLDMQADIEAQEQAEAMAKNKGLR